MTAHNLQFDRFTALIGYRVGTMRHYEPAASLPAGPKTGASEGSPIRPIPYTTLRSILAVAAIRRSAHIRVRTCNCAQVTDRPNQRSASKKPFYHHEFCKVALRTRDLAIIVVLAPIAEYLSVSNRNSMPAH